jgi:hypothetical protein
MKRTSTCFLLILFSILCHAQNSQTQTLSDTLHQPEVPQKDIVDILHKILHKKNNGDTIREGKKFNWSLIPAAGYTLQTGFAGVVSGNIGFISRDPEIRKFPILRPAIPIHSTNKQFSLYMPILDKRQQNQPYQRFQIPQLSFRNLWFGRKEDFNRSEFQYGLYGEL